MNRSVRLILALVGALMALSLPMLPRAEATPASTFEITDGDVADGANPAPDWDTIFGPGGVVENPAGTLAQVFVADPLSSDVLTNPPCAGPLSASDKGDPTVFGSTSDKNGDAFPTLTYKAGSVPNNKDDLSNVYSVIRIDPLTGHRILYFGVERVDNNGDAHIDFEYLQSGVGLRQTGSDSDGCPSGVWTGNRTIGDLLVTVDFTNGGALAQPSVREWNGTTYALDTDVTAADVATFTNTVAVPCGNWDCRNSSGAHNVATIPAQGLVEGFIDLDSPRVDFGSCLSGFNVHTRSSQEITAELKDFALGAFSTCDARIQLTPNGVNEVGDAHTFTATVQINPGTGFVAAPNGTVVDFSSTFGVLSSSTCTTTAGQCTVSLSSTTAGVATVNATTTVTVTPGVNLTRTTNGTGGSSGPATKRFVDAAIGITPTAVNEVGDPHTFTVTVTAIPSGTTPTFGTITPTVSPAPDSISDTCANPTVNGNVATCTVTINDAEVGTFTANASASVSYASSDPGADPAQVTVTRSTSGTSGPGGTGPATKRYVDAAIVVEPNAVNEVGDDHTFTVTFTALPGSASPTTFGAITPTVAPSGALVSTTCGTPTVESATVRSCEVVVGSDDAAVVTVDAAGSVTMGGVTVTRSTAGNSGPGGSSTATKRYVDGSVSITPSAVNEVGDPHTFTVTASAIPSGTTVTFDSITVDVQPAPPSIDDADCATPDVANDGLSASCTVTINSAAVGTYTANAAAAMTFVDPDPGADPASVTINRSTSGNAGPDGSGPATKQYVDATITIGQSAVNEVGDPHTFTVTLTALPGDVSDVAFGTITPSVSSGLVSSTCANPAVVLNTATCTITVNSATVGTITAGATGTVTIGGVPLTRTTDGTGGNSGAAVKRYVDATIAIAPSGVNEVDDPHTFTITVTAIPGTASPVLFGAIVPAITNGDDLTSMVSDCATPTVNGNVATCTVTIDSPIAQTYVATATATVTVGGTPMVRSTDGTGGNSGGATKRYVDASVSVSPDGTNPVGQAHAFTVTATADPQGTTASFDSIAITFSPSDPESITSDCDTPDVQGDVATCTVTINSTVVGSFDIDATATVTFTSPEAGANPATATVVRSTTGNSGPLGNQGANKRYVDASITIGPDATNEVGDPHVFTVTATANGGGQSVTFVSITPTVSGGYVSDTCGTPQVNGDTATCTVTVNSSTATVITAHAAAVIQVGSVQLTPETDGIGGNSDDATKRYVDAAVAIAPSGVNEVDDSHTFTVTVTTEPAGAGTPSFDSIAVSFLPTDPDTVDASDCEDPEVSPDGTTATCDVVISDADAEAFLATATAVVSIDGVQLTRTTDGAGSNSGPATKRFVDASITVTPDGVNPVNQAHVFTVRVTPQAAGTTVSNLTITPTVVPAPSSSSTTCGSPTLQNGVYSCTVTINSTSVTTYEVDAATTMTFTSPEAGATPSTQVVTRSTSGNAGPDGNAGATKRYVDATIAIAPNDTNNIGEPHTFTVTMTALRGSVPLADVSFGTITPSVSPAPATQSTTCGSPTVNGAVATCTVTINHDAAGVFTATATGTVTIGGVELTRSTNGQNGNSGAATKTYVAGSLRWVKHDSMGALLGGATFEVCRTHTLESATGTMVDTPDACITVLDDTDGIVGPGLDRDPAAGRFLLPGLVLGRFTVRETVAPSGWELDPSTKTANLTLAAPNADLSSTPFVDVPIQCGRTPGFWKTHPELWDRTTDYTVQQLAIVAANGGTTAPAFTTSTVFPWTAGKLAGKTYLEVMNTPTNGDITIILAQHYIAAVLNHAGYGVSGAVAGDILMAEDYFDGTAGRPGSTADNGDPDLVDQYTQPVGSNPKNAAKAFGDAILQRLAYANNLGETGCAQEGLPGSTTR